MRHATATLVALAIAGAYAPTALSSVAPAAPTIPVGSLTQPQIVALAREHRIPPELLVSHANDAALHVDVDRRLLYVDQGLHLPVFSQEPEPRGEHHRTAPAPLEETFELQTHPGANRTIYLDFDGHHVTSTSWNSTFNDGESFTAAAYDLDGDPATFNDAERTRIQQVWAQMAEDFAPFEVNVTTADPGTDALTRSHPADLTYGSRLVVTPSRGPLYNQCGCGGIAYVGAFDYPLGSSRLQPAFVFTAGTGNGAKNIAEAGSHEVGHNLGLLHDGTATKAYYTGHGSWAPIMGVGYSKPITQWSDGQYAGANNQQDDLQVAASHGAPFAADDHSDTPDHATPLVDRSVSVKGNIGVEDTDAFTFSTRVPGTVDLTADVARWWPNANLLMTLRDSTGSIVDSDSGNAQRATITADVPAGTYTLSVQPDSADDYPTYGALGRYYLQGELPALQRTEQADPFEGLGEASDYVQRSADLWDQGAAANAPVGGDQSLDGVALDIRRVSPSMLSVSVYDLVTGRPVRATVAIGAYQSGPNTLNLGLRGQQHVTRRDTTYLVLTDGAAARLDDSDPVWLSVTLDDGREASGWSNVSKRLLVPTTAADAFDGIPGPIGASLETDEGAAKLLR